jgi:hypothetical protein
MVIVLLVFLEVEQEPANRLPPHPFTRRDTRIGLLNTLSRGNLRHPLGTGKSQSVLSLRRVEITEVIRLLKSCSGL